MQNSCLEPGQLAFGNEPAFSKQHKMTDRAQRRRRPHVNCLTVWLLGGRQPTPAKPSPIHTEGARRPYLEHGARPQAGTPCGCSACRPVVVPAVAKASRSAEVSAARGLPLRHLSERYTRSPAAPTPHRVHGNSSCGERAGSSERGLTGGLLSRGVREGPRVCATQEGRS